MNSLEIDDNCCNRAPKVLETAEIGHIIKDFSPFVSANVKIEVSRGAEYFQFAGQNLVLAKTVDYDIGNKLFELELKFSDSSDEKFRNFKIDILNMNDNDPFFYDKNNGSPWIKVRSIVLDPVPETVQTGQVVGQLFANDIDCEDVCDSGLDFDIKFNSYVTINAAGELIVKDGSMFDFESNSENGLLPLQLRAYVSDNGVDPSK